MNYVSFVLPKLSNVVLFVVQKGLPSDSFSTENGVMVTRGSRYVIKTHLCRIFRSPERFFSHSVNQNIKKQKRRGGQGLIDGGAYNHGEWLTLWLIFFKS